MTFFRCPVFKERIIGIESATPPSTYSFPSISTIGQAIGMLDDARPIASRRSLFSRSSRYSARPVSQFVKMCIRDRIKERIKIAVIVCLEVIADVARMRLLINPLADRSLTALFVEGCLLHPLEHRGFSRCKQIHLCGKLLVQFFQMGR